MRNASKACRGLTLLIATSMLSSGSSATNATSTASDLFKFLTSERYTSRLGLHPELISKWLSPELLGYAKVIECESAQAQAEEPAPTTTVGAELFFDRWDTPSRCTASEAIGTDEMRTATINCVWGKGHDHRNGTRIQLLVHLQPFEGRWKVTNVTHGKQEDFGKTDTDLVTRMKEAMSQSVHPEICAKLQSPP